MKQQYLLMQLSLIHLVYEFKQANVVFIAKFGSTSGLKKIWSVYNTIANMDLDSLL